jgi:hypothetical protein
MLLCRTGPLPRKPGRTKGWNLLPDCVRSCPSFYKISYALATLKVTIVLPVFARSCFADRREERRNLVGGRVLRMGNVVAWLFNSPDYATLVDPLCEAERVRRRLKLNPLSAQRREGGRAKQRPGESTRVRDCSGYRPAPNARRRMSIKPGPQATPWLKNNDLFIALFSKSAKRVKIDANDFNGLPRLKFPGSLLIK